MTKEEVLAMKPGRELNIKVAETIMWNEVVSDEIFGDVERYIDGEGSSVYGPLRSYSEDISAAQSVVDRMVNLGHGDEIFFRHYANGIYTSAEDICKAALLIMLAKEN